MCQAADMVLTNAADMGSIPPPGRSHMSGSNTSLCAATPEACTPHSPRLEKAPQKSDKDPLQPK